MLQHSCVTRILPLLVAGLVAGCSLDPADCAICQLRSGGGGVQSTTSFPAGELGGACLADDTCDEGLECLADICMPDSTADTMLVFHNNTGPMCLAALRWMEEAQAEYSSLVVEEHLTTRTREADLLDRLMAQFTASEGYSASFQYLPSNFYRGRALSGFDSQVEATLEALLQPEDEEIP